VIEGVFMVGVLAGAWIFGWFVGADADGRGWLRVYWLLAALCGVARGLWLITRLDERAATASDEAPAGWREMARLAVLPATVATLLGLFLYVLIEQGVGTWLPTFNSEVLHLPAAMSVQMSSIYLAALALGRLASGIVLRRVAWLPVLLGCIACTCALVLAALPLAHGIVPRPIAGWGDAPLAAWLFPLIGFFLAPIYPTICSVALSALPRNRHPGMVGLIVIFSALGGTIGSLITGLLFQKLPGALAFYFVLVPAALIGVVLVQIRRHQTRQTAT
jgi:fucose permease